MAERIQLQKIRKEYSSGEDNIIAVNNISLEIPSGSFTTLVGPSGCGKTTTLRMMAGLETPTKGDIYFGDANVTKKPPQDRNISMVFQNIALYPHMTVRENIGYGLKVSGVSKPELDARVEEASKSLQINDQLDKKPSELSGGQQQRVALGSVFVERPDILLLDEPMSDLDAKLKAELRVELQRLHQQLDVTVVYVTHDQTEAMTMSDYIALLNKGDIEQFDTPLEMFDNPVSEYAATFIGTPSTNIIDSTIISENGNQYISGPGYQINTPTQEMSEKAVKIGIRPQYLTLDEDQQAIDVVVDVIEPLGTESVIHARTPDDEPFDIVSDNVADIKEGDQIKAYFDQNDIFIFDSEGESVNIDREQGPSKSSVDLR